MDILLWLHPQSFGQDMDTWLSLAARDAGKWSHYPGGGRSRKVRTALAAAWGIFKMSLTLMPTS